MEDQKAVLLSTLSTAATRPAESQGYAADSRHSFGFTSHLTAQSPILLEGWGLKMEPRTQSPPHYQENWSCGQSSLLVWPFPSPLHLLPAYVARPRTAPPTLIAPASPRTREPCEVPAGMQPARCPQVLASIGQPSTPLPPSEAHTVPAVTRKGLKAA